MELRFLFFSLGVDFKRATVRGSGGYGGAGSASHGHEFSEIFPVAVSHCIHHAGQGPRCC